MLFLRLSGNYCNSWTKMPGFWRTLLSESSTASWSSWWKHQLQQMSIDVSLLIILHNQPPCPPFTSSLLFLSFTSLKSLFGAPHKPAIDQLKPRPFLTQNHLWPINYIMWLKGKHHHDLIMSFPKIGKRDLSWPLKIKPTNHMYMISIWCQVHIMI